MFIHSVVLILVDKWIVAIFERAIEDRRKKVMAFYKSLL